MAQVDLALEDGDIDIITPPKLGIWNTLVEGETDATWVFIP
jgi:hypothetical protein